MRYLVPFVASSLNLMYVNVQEYLSIPTVTRGYTTACVLTTVAVVSRPFFSSDAEPNSLIIFLKQLDLVSPFQLYFNPTLIFKHYQVSSRAIDV